MANPNTSVVTREGIFELGDNIYEYGFKVESVLDLKAGTVLGFNSTTQTWQPATTTGTTGVDTPAGVLKRDWVRADDEDLLMAVVTGGKVDQDKLVFTESTNTTVDNYVTNGLTARNILRTYGIYAVRTEDLYTT